eukprot:9541-Heterococcus_DN1.PRE.3
MVSRLYFLTRRSKIEGLSSALLRQLRRRLCRDIAFDLDSAGYVADVGQWLHAQRGEGPETAELLRLYASRAEWANQFLLTLWYKATASTASTATASTATSTASGVTAAAAAAAASGSSSGAADDDEQQSAVDLQAVAAV